MAGYDVIPSAGVPIKAWTRGVTVEAGALQQLENVATLPFVYPHVAAMPDVHAGIGATIGSVIPCRRAIIPAAVGVDIGCGMMAVQTNLTSQRLPDTLHELRSAIEAAVPHGRTAHGKARVDRGAWGTVPDDVAAAWTAERAGGDSLADGLTRIVARHPKLGEANSVAHLGTLGTGNHFIEVCLDEADRVWVMLHSGSRGIGNAIGRTFIALAKQDMRRHAIPLPDADLAYFSEEAEHFAAYVDAVHWAQTFAQVNREVMMARVLRIMTDAFPGLEPGDIVIDCHHNYVERERHFGEDLWVTRKGAVSARRGEFGIIPGSMGARSYIVRGLGEAQSFCSCSHGAGRAMSRTEARRRFSVADLERATAGVECRKDAHVLDETPMAYKDIDAVMAAQTDLVAIVHTLKQIVCVKG